MAKRDGGGREKASIQVGEGVGDFQEEREERERRNEWREKTKRGEHFAHPSFGSCDPSPAGRQKRVNSDQTFMSAAFLAGSVPD